MVASKQKAIRIKIIKANQKANNGTISICIEVDENCQANRKAPPKEGEGEGEGEEFQGK